MAPIVTPFLLAYDHLSHPFSLSFFVLPQSDATPVPKDGNESVQQISCRQLAHNNCSGQKVDSLCDRGVYHAVGTSCCLLPSIGPTECNGWRNTEHWQHGYCKPHSSPPMQDRAATVAPGVIGAVTLRSDVASNHFCWLSADIRWTCAFACAHMLDCQAEEASAAGGVGAHGTLIVADKQTKGIGRRNRGWASEPEGNLYVSFIWAKAGLQAVDCKYCCRCGACARALSRRVPPRRPPFFFILLFACRVYSYQEPKKKQCKLLVCSRIDSK